MSEKSTLTVYGTAWCPDCIRSIRFLARHQVAYTWIDIDQDRDGEAFVIKQNQGRRTVPTIVFPDGAVLAEPSNQVLARKLNLEKTSRW